jgi:hypothetical protein
MQMHVSEATYSEDNLPARFTQGSRVYTILLKVSSTSGDGKRDPVLSHIVRGTSSNRAL